MLSLVFLIVLLGQPIYGVDEIVVTATRYPTALKDVALATLVIDRKEIEAQRSLSLGEILQYNAGIDIKDYGTPGSVSSLTIRGIQSNGSLILLNGHPLNSITTGMADLSSININTIERIEIVKGPVSSLYGANALGGVVNIITTKNYEQPSFGVKITPSTTTFAELSQTKELFMSAGIPFGKTSLGIAGAYNASSGFRSNSDFTNYHLRGCFAENLDKVQISSALTYNSKEYGSPGPMPLVDSLHPVPLLGDSTATSLFDRVKDRIILGDINIKWCVLENLKWANNLFVDRKLTRFHTTYPGWLGDTITEDFDYLVHTFGLNTMAAISINGSEIILGIDAHYDTLKTTKSSKQAGDIIWNASSYNVASWLEIKKDVNKNLVLTPSIRLDRNSDFGNFLSPQLGMVSSLMKSLWIKISIGKAFRAPTFNDLYWPIYGNPDLRPEQGWAYELRCETSPLYNSFVALSLFMRNVKDRIFWLPVENGMWQPQNVNYISIKGFDIEIRGQINEAIGISLEGTYLNARQKNSEITYDFYDWMADTSLTIVEEVERDAAFIPKYTLSSKINFRLPHGFNVNLTGSYIAERINYYPTYDNYPSVSMDEKKLDAFLLLNACIHKDLFKYCTLSTGAKNLFDIEYATQFGNSVNDLNYPMPRRIFFVQLMWRQE